MMNWGNPNVEINIYEEDRSLNWFTSDVPTCLLGRWIARHYVAATNEFKLEVLNNLITQSMLRPGRTIIALMNDGHEVARAKTA